MLSILASSPLSTVTRASLRESGIPPATIDAAVIRGVIVDVGAGAVSPTACGLLFYHVTAGPHRWASRGPISAMQQILHQVSAERRSPRDMVSSRARPSLPRFIHVMKESSLIRRFGSRIYLTRHGHQFARMDLTIQG